MTREEDMNMHLEQGLNTNAKSIDRLKHIFEAQNIATELLKETSDERYRAIIVQCEEASSEVMTQGISARLPKFLLKRKQ